MTENKNNDFLYTLLGGALLLKERFSDQFDEILKKGEASKEELKESASETLDKAHTQKEEIESELKNKIKMIVDELGLATKEDIAELKALISQNQK